MKLAQCWAIWNGGAQTIKLKAMRGAYANRGAKGEHNETVYANEPTVFCRR